MLPRSPRRRAAGIAGYGPVGDRGLLVRVLTRKNREHAAKQRGGTYRPTKAAG